MPIYEYECGQCRYYLEVMQKISDAKLKKCPSCGKNALQRLISAPVFRLKGSGWYETDFKSDQERKRNLVAGEKDESSADSKGSKDAKDSKDSKESKDAKSDATETTGGSKAAGETKGEAAAADKGAKKTDKAPDRAPSRNTRRAKSAPKRAPAKSKGPRRRSRR